MSLHCDLCPVRDSAACSALETHEREDLARVGRMRKIRKGELLFAAGDENTACATLVEGALKVSAVDEDGNERILALIHPAGFVGELFSPFAHHDVIALADSRLCVFGRGDLDAALTRHPKLARALLRRSQEDLHETRQLIALTSRRSASERVAGLLMGLADAASHSPCHAAQSFQLPLSRQEIADLLNLTIETVSRSLTRLEKDGLIRRKGTRGIELLDASGLAEMAGAA
ncbi:MAG: Crp/Fnr family transcriptional regulator [Novosphingobium sp.]|nr:Crp/Fnr family transcriptional regulator [Novosphingobium sp.]MBO9601394.1 Crp/Fnr family transcriptional regulator [Novosphingobium sp.]